MNIKSGFRSSRISYFFLCFFFFLKLWFKMGGGLIFLLKIQNTLELNQVMELGRWEGKKKSFSGFPLVFGWGELFHSFIPSHESEWHLILDGLRGNRMFTVLPLASWRSVTYATPTKHEWVYYPQKSLSGSKIIEPKRKRKRQKGRKRKQASHKL